MTNVNTDKEAPATRVYTPKIITVAVFEAPDSDEPTNEYITDLSNPTVPVWLSKLIYYAASSGKSLTIDPTPDATINFMPNPFKMRK